MIRKSREGRESREITHTSNIPELQILPYEYQWCIPGEEPQEVEEEEPWEWRRRRLAGISIPIRRKRHTEKGFRHIE